MAAGRDVWLPLFVLWQYEQSKITEWKPEKEEQSKIQSYECRVWNMSWKVGTDPL